MKTNLKSIALGLITLFLFTSARAQNTADASSPLVTYVGIKDNKVAFNVKFENSISKNFELELVNENGDILYSKKFSDKVIDKDIIIRNETNNKQLELNFIIRAGSNIFNNSFSVSTVTKTVNEVEVTRL